MGTRLNCLGAKTKIVGTRYNQLTALVLTCTHNLCLSKNMKIIMYVAWAGFRNVKHSSLCTDLVNM